MKILLTGGAGYVGSACLRWLLRTRARSDRLRQFARGQRRGRPRRLSPADRGRHRRDRSPGSRAGGLSCRGGHAFRGAGLGPRFDRGSRGLLSGQRHRHQERARRDADGRGAEDPLQQHRGDLRLPIRDALAGGFSSAPRNAIRDDEARRRMAHQGLRTRLRLRLHPAALLQCVWRRFRWTSTARIAATRAT